MAETHTRLTLEDISKEIHISRTTIYKVINNKGTVSEKTRETVLAALENMTTFLIITPEIWH